MRNKHAIFIVGPTAVGKTDIALRVAEELFTGILSADSRQMYRELRIGTAAPNRQELERVPHYLLQHRSVSDYYNASMYETEALGVLEKVFTERDTLVIAGGSGLYIKAISEGIDDIPTVDPKIRGQLQQKLNDEGLESLRFELRKLDPVSYKTLDLKNPNRILKALEISIMTGKPYSTFLGQVRKKRNFRILKIGLNLDRDVLYERINQRVDAMMEAGLLEEVRGLLPMRAENALKTVGYKELFDYLDGNNSLEEAITLIKRNTRHYARRQLTWFRRDKEIQWFNPLQFEEIMLYIRRHVETAG